MYRVPETVIQSSTIRDDRARQMEDLLPGWVSEVALPLDSSQLYIFFKRTADAKNSS